jgi:hypothetical protein
MFYTARGYDLMAENIEQFAGRNRVATSNVASFPGPAIEREVVSAVG